MYRCKTRWNLLNLPVLRLNCLAAHLLVASKNIGAGQVREDGHDALFVRHWSQPTPTPASSALSYFHDERDDLMDSINDRLASIGPQLPDEPLRPGGSYVPFVWSGNQLLAAGQICRVGEEMQFTGVVGDGLTVEEGQAAASLCALNTLAVAGAACGGDFSRLR